MASTPLILSIDQGTTSSRSLVFDANGRIVSSAQCEYKQHFPKPGWVEHVPDDIWRTTVQTADEAMTVAEQQTGGKIECIGITNQRETTIVWDKRTGQALGNAIVWQDRRTSGHCEELRLSGKLDEIVRRTGLTIDPYFSATKLRWILENVDGAIDLAEQGNLAFGTIDTFLIYRLTGGKHHLTDETNASRTLLYNINEGDWDDWLLNLFEIPRSVLPDIRPSSSSFGETDPKIFGRSIPILGVAGDQQAAAFGQACWHPGMIKSTYGTGCFMLASSGNKIVRSQSGLLSTVACRTGAERQFAVEGSIFIAGAVSQWLRDELHIIEDAAETESLAASVSSNEGVYVVPAFTGLGAPHWDSTARGAIFGLTRNTGRAVLTRAAIEAVAYQTNDLVASLISDGLSVDAIRVDGGMVANSWFLQFLSDILEVRIDRPVIIESTARGAAFLAGLKAGIFSNTEQLEELWAHDRQFTPSMLASERQALVSGWQAAVKATLFHASLN
ncbi:glycerol kinase [Henriciella mobilis]|uniref:glycerol kinase GlpK n=1 Tax=Henriciella mobilis TaxID=2305467 RepID=UPI000E660801|nr:glycerol kinase GlpK [Henriciella mobilis]RIJ15373.1 glycerol kinase [Henriciella mobilis]RIJ18837.1 glycerol kinase [Henriciella mobilis]